LYSHMLLSRNAEAQLPLASLSKVMTAYIAERNLGRDASVIISGSDIEKEGDNGLLVDERWSLGDLLDFTLVVSSNDGASALAAALLPIVRARDGVETITDLMNAEASRLGLSQTYFLNESGLDLDEESLSGSYGSARDIVLLFDYILRESPGTLSGTTVSTLYVTSESGVSHTGKNTNEIIGIIAGLVASKTGFTDLAGGNLVVAFDAGLMQPVIISVLGSSKEGRFEDMKKLIAAVQLSISTQ